MAAWTFKGESGKSFVDTAVTLESQGVSAATVSFRSLEPDILTLEYQVADYAASSTLPELRQTISLYRDSDRFFYGNVIRVSPKVDANSSTVIVEVAGPWWWLDRIPMTSSQVDGEGNSATRPMFVFGDFTSGASMKANLEAAIDRAIALGAPVIRGTISATFTVPRITLNQSTCGDVLSELVRLIPDTMLWFDYSGTGYATLNISRRADASTPTRTVAVGTDDVTALNIQPLIELEVSQVKVPFVTRATTGETQYTTQDSGSSSTGKVEILPVSGPELVDFLPNDQLDTIKIANTYDGNDTGLLSAIKKEVYPGWADVVASVAGAEGVNYGLSAAQFYIYSTAGVTVDRNLSTAAAGPAGETYAAGTHYFNQTSYPSGKKFVCFENGQDPPQWAIDQFGIVEYFPAHITWYDQNLSGSTYNQARRYAIMDATQWSLARATSIYYGIDPAAGTYMFAAWFPDKEARLWMMDTASVPADNTLIRGADFTFAAPPANFAANLLAAQNYIPHEGSIELTSSDTGATRFRGTKVRVTGSLSTMTAMDALVSGETLDIREGSTQVELGQPPRLDFLEFVNRVRRTPQDNTQYVADAVSGVTPLLDATDVPAATLAYSLRKLRAAYSGKALKLRRTTGSVEVDVDFDASGKVGYGSAITVTSGSYSGTMTLEAFCEADDCFVKTWYDQTGNNRDMTQATASAQPKLISSGTLLDAPTYDGTDDLMVSNYEFESTYDDVQWLAVCNPSSVSESNGLMSDLRTFNQGIELMTDSTPKWRMHVQNDDFITALAAPVVGTDYLVNISYRKTSLSGGQGDIVRINGNEEIKAVNKNLFASQRTPFFIGARRAPNHGGASFTLQNPYHGRIAEVCGWESVFTSAQEAAVEANVAEYHGITLA